MDQVSTTARAQCARVAALTRYRVDTDPELVEARMRLREQAFLAAVKRAAAIAPPMDSPIREQAFAILFPESDVA
ncbi:MAG: hypothetical protein K2X52_15980 [Mycobacteriaceae bacterium]|nr:hypothetical protein [Mycobacteriaceae bacterium]